MGNTKGKISFPSNEALRKLTTTAVRFKEALTGGVASIGAWTGGVASIGASIVGVATTQASTGGQPWIQLLDKSTQTDPEDDDQAGPSAAKRQKTNDENTEKVSYPYCRVCRKKFPDGCAIAPACSHILCVPCLSRLKATSQRPRCPTCNRTLGKALRHLHFA
ncbi:GL19712 [Drosophila persimilis]|uniref:GL19712 n=1 Tax=Drosophila persimilis TaxID=7234 RepID=B4HB52_DROPE|nr:GL19712 [Drosophila persimilis]